MKGMKIQGNALGGVTRWDDEWITEFDPDANDGRGKVRTSPDPSRALKFDDAASALELWRTRSRVRPTRDDGKPNRPLTAFNVEVVTIP